MGQNSSNLGGNALASPRRKNTGHKPPRPSEPPKIPKPPKYVVPENKVIPNGVNDMEKARKLLRPVSQELTKIHPDFADIFQYDPELDFLAGADDSSLERSLYADNFNKENTSLGLFNNSSRAIQTSGKNHTEATSNGSVPNGNANTTSSTVELQANGGTNHVLPTGLSNSYTSGALQRSQSMQRGTSRPPKYAMHKRQSSFSNGPSINQSVIIEDPREHLYNITRSQPFSNLMPSTASLPLENSFGLDYSFNVTYAQLAEHRRQRRMSELEEKTGQKLNELSADIYANNVVPKSPFDRQAVGSKSGPLSVSTGSSETGVSKSKKKRAPAPPGSSTNGAEPPVDYDMVSLSSVDLQRRNSSSSGKLKPAPQILPKRSSVSGSNQSITEVSKGKSVSKQAPNSSESNVDYSTLSPPPPPPPPPPPLPPLPSAVSSQPHTGGITAAGRVETKSVQPGKTKMPGKTSLHESMDLAKAQLEALKRLEDVLKNPTPREKELKEINENGVENIPNSITSSNNNTHEEVVQNSPKIDENKNRETNASTTSKNDIIINITTESMLQSGEASESSVAKKMSSLLQHDIVLAAQARGNKVKKTRTPHALEKPLDASEVFRQELAKAASAREERRRSGLVNNLSSGDELESRSSSSQNNSRLSTPNTSINNTVTTTKASASFVVDRQNGFAKSKTELDNEFEVNIISKHSNQQSIHSEDMSISSSSSQRVFSSNWTPEDDLDSDDDILAEECSPTNQSSHSAGFKSSIVPSNIKDLKKGKKEKRRQKNNAQLNSSSTNERKKLESVRKLKDSVQSSVKNAFGSISRASGKLLKKNKSQDFLETHDQPEYLSPRVSHRKEHSGSNWELASSNDGSIRRSVSNANMEHNFYTNEDEDGDSDSSSDADSDVGDIDFSTGINESHLSKKKRNVRRPNEKPMKAAGASYVVRERGGKSIALSSNGHQGEDNISSRGKKYGLSKLLRKKDKFGKESKVNDGGGLSKEIQERERLVELDKQKQLEMGDNFKRLRDLDSQERLQRMQTANMQQQITMLQQRQIQQAHTELNNSNSLGVSTPGLTTSSPIPQGTPMANSTFMASSSLDFTSLPSVLNLPVNAPNLGYSNHHHHHHHQQQQQQQQQQEYPISLQREALMRGMEAPIFSGTFNTSQFTTHSGPMIGGTSQAPAVPPNLTNQELSYLSEYMRVMGVQPPSTHQQWALLLSTMRMNTPQLQAHGFGGFGQSNVHTGVTLNNSSGLNPSHFFGSEKRIETALLDSTHTQDIHPAGFPRYASHHQQHPMQPFVSSYSDGGDTNARNLNINSNNKFPINSYSSPGGFQTRNASSTFNNVFMENNNNLASHQMGSKDVLDNTNTDNAMMPIPQQARLSEGLPSFDDTNSPSVVENGYVNNSNHPYTNKYPASPIPQTSPEHLLDLRMSTNMVPSQVMTIQRDADSTAIGSSTHPMSNFSSKAYAPIGFRPVTFKA